jgi:hypothetical protein
MPLNYHQALSDEQKYQDFCYKGPEGREWAFHEWINLISSGIYCRYSLSPKNYPANGNLKATDRLNGHALNEDYTQECKAKKTNTGTVRIQKYFEKAVLGLVYLSQKGDSADSHQKKFEKIDGILTFIHKLVSENFIPELLYIFSEWLCTQFMLHHRQEVILQIILNFHLTFFTLGLPGHIKAYFDKICSNYIPTDLAYLSLFATNINRLIAKYQSLTKNPPLSIPTPLHPHLTFYCKFCNSTNESFAPIHGNNCSLCGIKSEPIWSFDKFDRQKFDHGSEGDVNGDRESGEEGRGVKEAALRENLKKIGEVKVGLVGELGVEGWWDED